MLTPIVIVDLDDVDAVTTGFRQRVDSVVKDMVETYQKRAKP